MPAVTLTHLSLTLLLNETVVQHCSLSQIAASMTTIIDFFFLFVVLTVAQESDTNTMFFHHCSTFAKGRNDQRCFKNVSK